MTTVSNTPSLFKNKNFLLLFLGGFVSRIGNGVHYIALTWFILDLTKSGTAAGMIMFLSTIPGVVLGPIGGVIADRINRKLLIVGMDFISGLVVLYLGWMVLAGGANFWHLSIVTVLLACCGAFFNPAVGATVPNIVRDEDLQKATSLEHFSINFTNIIGAAIGGILIAVFGVGMVFVLNGISFLISGLSELFIKIPPIQKDADAEPVTIIEDLKFGAQYIYQRKDIFTLFSLSILTNFLFAGTLLVGMPFVFKQLLSVSSNLYGLGQAIFPAGAVLGAIILSLSPDVKSYYRVLIFTTPVIGLAFIGLGIPLLPALMARYAVVKLYLIIIAILFGFGVVNSICNIPLNVILQRIIPDHVRGRVFGFLSSLNRALVPISMALTGILLDRIPPFTLFFSVGAIWLVIILLASRIEVLKTIGMDVQPNPEQDLQMG